jgi:all-trans-retinol 13,14-reductase
VGEKTVAMEESPSTAQRNPHLIRSLAGFIPWIIYWAFETISHYAVLAAFGVAILFILRRYQTERKIMLLDSAILLFFSAHIIFTFILGNSLFINYGGLISWLVLAGTAFCSILAGYPFTSQMAKDSIPKKFWDEPLFMETNNILTGIWGIIFLADAIISSIGSSENSLILAALIPNLLVITAIACSNPFGRWYARKRTERSPKV